MNALPSSGVQHELFIHTRKVQGGEGDIISQEYTYRYERENSS